MPIRITKVGRQRTVAGLAKALFDTRGSAALQERAESALLRANPALGEEGGIKAGITVIVPSVRDLQPKKETTPAASASMSLGMAAAAVGAQADPVPVIALAQGRAAALAELGGRSLKAALGNARRSVRELKSEETIAALLAARPDLREGLDAVRVEADKEVKRIAEAGKQLQKATASALKDLAAVSDVLKPGG